MKWRRAIITLHTFGPYFGLPDPSPFVMKVMLLLKFAGLPYTEKVGSLTRAPKGKLPFIEDDGEIIADSTFIRFHIEEKYGVNFDSGLSAEQRAAAWAAEKMCEEHLYFALMASRWASDANFARGPAKFFESIPLPLRPAVRAMARRRVKKSLQSQGIGRHSPAERDKLAIRDIEALSALIGGKTFLMGERPCGADATVSSFITQLLCPVFDSPMRAAAEQQGNLISYRDRILQCYFGG
ncbi:MAG TPA: glutathione S-transferase family protein [Methylocella sp.]|nr:glutathione S-transferase family protein [Methylocella sp.]